MGQVATNVVKAEPTEEGLKGLRELSLLCLQLKKAPIVYSPHAHNLATDNATVLGNLS